MPYEAKKRSYTQEFKDPAVNLLTEQESQEDEDLRKEIVRLKKENRRLQMEREILKKAAAFFAKESGNGIKIQKN
uniref:hypothetical protein n=1 Tax=Desulfogranum japonicum TaxID=231447 RepID=UPI0004177C16|nr:hypothetical protein [Desulfogranum japonicum]